MSLSGRAGRTRRAVGQPGCEGTSEGVRPAAVRPRGFSVDAAMVLLVVGYGLFKSLSDQMYASAMSTVASSYLVINSVGFSISVSYPVIAATVLLMVLAWRWPGVLLRRSGAVCTVLLAAANLASCLGLFGWMEPRVALVLLAGIYGTATTFANVAWLVAVAGLAPRRCLATLASSYLLAAGVSELAGRLPTGVSAGMLAVAGLAAAALLFVVPTKPEVAQGFYAEPGTTRKDLASAGERLPGAWALTRGVVAENAGPIVIFLVLNMVIGLITSFQVIDAQAVEGASTLRFLATAASNLLLLGVAAFAKGMPNIRRIFGLLFPLVALFLVALPFVDRVYGELFNTLLMFLRGAVSTMVLFMLLEAARRHRVSAAVLVAAVSLAARVSVFAGLVAGTLLGWQGDLDATVKTLLVSVVSIYLLSLVLVWLNRSRAAAAGFGTSKPSGVEKPMQVGSPEEFTAAVVLDGFAGDGDGTAGDDADAAGMYAAGAGMAGVRLDGAGAIAVGMRSDSAGTAGAWGERGPEGEVAAGGVQAPAADPLAERAAELAEEYRLTARELDVSLLLARGRSAAYIADELGISANTVRGYAKGAYAKLDVHSKQELIDLFMGTGE